VRVKIVPGWLRGYERAWLGRDVVAGLIVGSVVVPQAVAYAQIAGLPPSAGLAAAPGALIGYALLGTSRSLVVSATTATSALSLAAVGPLANGDTGKFAALSAALALIAGAILVASGVLRLGGVMDLVSKPVMTGFLFGLGLTVAMSQLPKIFGVPAGDGNFFPRLADLARDLDDTSWWTLAVGLTSIVALLALGRVAPRVPAMLVVLAGSIVVSAILDLGSHGVAIVGKLPSALPDPAVPDVGWGDLVDLLPAAVGMLILSAEAAGVSRAIAEPRATASTSTATSSPSAARTCSPDSRAASSSRAAPARPWPASAPAARRSSRRLLPPGSSFSRARFSPPRSKTYPRQPWRRS
jgi:SulP family sulfate permease